MFWLKKIIKNKYFKKTIISLIGVLLFILLVIWARYNSNNIPLKRAVSQNGEELQITQEKDGLKIGNGRVEITLKNLKETKKKETEIYYKNYEGDKAKGVETQMIYFDDSGFNYEKAEIKIPKTGKDYPVNKILTCEDQDFNKETGECSNWQETDIKPVDNGDFVTFETEHFSAYMGISSLSKGLVGHWPLNQETAKSSTVVADKTPYINDGTLTNGPVFTTGPTGKSNDALDFDGDNDYVDLGSITSSSKLALAGSNFTISAWIYKESGGDGYQRIIDKSNGASGANGYSFFVQNLQPALSINGNSFYVTNTSAISYDSWHHLVLISDQTSVKVYVNGQEEAGTWTTGSHTTPPAVTTNMRIGTWNHSTAREWNGRLADIRVYNRTISVEEINLIYNSFGQTKFSAGSFNKGLVGHWPLNQETAKSSTVVADKTPYINDGTLTNGPVFAAGPSGKSNDALDFDGTDDRVAMPSTTILPDGSWTIAYWFYEDAVSNMTVGEYNTNPNRIQHLSGNTTSAYVRVHYDDANYTDSSLGKITLNNGWHHLVVTAEGTSIKAYLDGVLTDTDTKSANRFDFNSIGLPYSNVVYCWDGKLADVRIYNRPISLEEVKLIYDSFGQTKASAGSLNKGLVGYWPLDSKSYQEYTGFDINSSFVAYNSISEAVGNNAVNGVEFNNDGRKFYITDTLNSEIFEYTLSQPWNLSSIVGSTYSYLLNISARATNPRDVIFNNNGTVMLVVDDGGDAVDEFHLSVGWDLSTASYDSTLSISSYETSPRGIEFNKDGTKMFIIGDAGLDINEYNCSTGFDVSTCTYDSALSISSQATSPKGMAFSNNGKKLFFNDTSGVDVNQYNCTTAFDVSTCSFSRNYSVATESAFPYGIDFNSDGTKMYVVSPEATLDRILTYDLNKFPRKVGDLTSFEKNGEIFGAIPTTDRFGNSGNALDFDGTDDYIALSSQVTLSHGSWTIAYWFRQDANDNMTIGQYNASANRFYHRSFTTSGAYITIHFNDNVSINVSLGKATNDGWHHIAVTASGDTIYTYTDGNLSDTDTKTTNQFVVDNIGLPYNNAAYAWDGGLADVRLYNRTLDSEEIKLLYQQR